MAVRRKKSIDDIRRQAERLRSQTGGNSARRDRINEIENRYRDNITWTDAYRKRREQNFDFLSQYDDDYKARIEAGRQADRDVKVSRSTYMGLNAG